MRSRTQRLRTLGSRCRIGSSHPNNTGLEVAETSDECCIQDLANDGSSDVRGYNKRSNHLVVDAGVRLTPIPQFPTDSHYMQLPREVLIGKDVAPHVGETLKRLGYSGTALIVTGPRVRFIAAEIVVRSLDQAGFKSSIVITESATTDEVSNVQREIKLRSADIVVGVGGGKDIDVAKLSSMKEQKIFLSVPTAASHDGIANPLVSMKGLNRPYSYVAHSPVAIVADTSIIGKSPYRLIASGCGDVLAKYTAVRDWKLAHRIK